MKNFTFLLLLSSPLLAAEMRVHRDLPYAEPQHARRTLDLYAPATGDQHPVMIWIHGGGWRQGDKSRLQHKPRAFVDRGFVFVSINYRLRPEVTVSEMTGDIAKAINWVREHAAEYGGAADRLFVAGHSAGAHLAALVCTDERYLRAEGLSPANVKGCIPVDVSVYDLPRRLKEGGSVPPATFTAIFGESEESHRDLSPVHHVHSGKTYPAFLILHVASRRETRDQSERFADVLRSAGVPARVVAARGKTHATINADLGLPDDEPTRAMWEFLDSLLKP